MSDEDDATDVSKLSSLPGAHRRWFRSRLLVGAGLLGVLGALAVGLPWVGMRLTTADAIVPMANVGQGAADVALVLGAGVRPDGTPTPVLSERVRTGVMLYRRGAVRKLIMSGDNSRVEYDEVTAMKNLAVNMGVPAGDVLLDYAGFTTMNSCVRLRKVFGQTRAVVVSQRFHLARAIHLCRFAEIDTIGVSAADPRSSGGRWQSSIREVPASTLAWWSVHVFGAKPKFLGPSINIDAPPPEAREQPRPD